MMKSPFLKKLLAFTLTLSLSFSFAVSNPAETSAASAYAIEGYLAWSDEFNSKSLNTEPLAVSFEISVVYTFLVLSV